MNSYKEDAYHIYILFDLVEGPNLEDLFRARHLITEAETSSYAAQTLEALSHMNANNIVHKYVKLSNIILSVDKTRLQLCDFAQSALVDGKPLSHRSPVCGTPN